MAGKPKHKALEPFEMRRYREAGVSVKEVAALAECSVATVMRELAKLRKKLGPERFGKDSEARHAGHRARAHLYLDDASSHNLTSNTTDAQ